MIHIKRSMAFGDVLWIEPIVRYFLSLKHPVNVITTYPEVFENYPHPNLTVNYKNYFKIKHSLHLLKDFFKKRIIDLDYTYESQPKMHILEAYKQTAGIQNMDLTYPRIYLTDKEKHPKLDTDYIVLHIEENPRNFRNVYSVDWNEIVKYLRSQGLQVVQISKNPHNIYGDWIKTKNFRDVMSLIFSSKLFIGLDSGPSHVAAALGIPSILFFGAVNPAFRHLSTFKGIFLQGFCEYAHCYHEIIGCGQTCKLVGDQGIPKCCSHSTEKVIEAINRIFEGNLRGIKAV